MPPFTPSVNPDSTLGDAPTRRAQTERECLDMADVLLADLRRAALEDTRPMELDARAGHVTWLQRIVRRLSRIE